MKKILVCILFILGLLSVESKAQKVAVKSNLLYDATTTMVYSRSFDTGSAKALTVRSSGCMRTMPTSM